MHKQAKHSTITLAIVGALALMSGSLATADSVTVTNTFVAGQPATAASVNQNFMDVETAVNDNDGRITTNTGNIATNTGDIATNTGNIATNTGDIETNTGDIANNTGDIATNTGDIDTNTGDIANNTDRINLNEDDLIDNILLASDNEMRITTLEGVITPSSADNLPILVDCETQSLQAAIEAAPIHGKTVIMIDGACSDDIFLRRSGITIEGMTGPGTDSITGDSSGFSSDPLDDFNLPAAGGALVQRVLSAAFEMDQRARVILKNLTINAGANPTAVMADRNSSLSLINVTLNGGADGFGLHSRNSDVVINMSTIEGSGGGTIPFAGTAVFADANSVIRILSGNTFNGGDGDTIGFAALSNTTVRLEGVGNTFNAGTGQEPLAIEIALNSSLAQLPPPPSDATIGVPNNTINGDVATFNSHMFFSSMAFNSPIFEIRDSASVLLEASAAGEITITGVLEFEIGNNSSLELGEESDPPITINTGLAGVMRLLDHSSLIMFNGSQVNMDVELFRGCSVDAGNDSDIGGNLQVGGFSSYGSIGQDVLGSVAGVVTCFNGEANDDIIGTGFIDLCNPT